MAAEKTPRRLGRGLEALLKQKPAVQDASPGIQTVTIENTSPLKEIAISSIRANQYQPRKTFKSEELEELKNSISASGLLQPITVRKLSEDNSYELVAGERRLRAVQLLGWTNITSIVRDYDDQTMLTLALIENLQRSDLNTVEEAEGYQRLSDEFGLTQSEIAKLVGKDRSTVANLLRILQLPTPVKKLIETGSLTAGHARPLLSLENESEMSRIANEIVQQGLSVRAVEERVRAETNKGKKESNVLSKPSSNSQSEPKIQKTGDVKYVENLLRNRLQTDVSVDVKNGEKGELRIQFYSYEDLNRLLELMDALE